MKLLRAAQIRPQITQITQMTRVAFVLVPPGVIKILDKLGERIPPTGQWVDRSDLAYERRCALPYGNPTNAVGGSFILNLQRVEPRERCFSLPTNAVGELRKNLVACVHRLSMNDPPTARLCEKFVVRPLGGSL